MSGMLGNYSTDEADGLEGLGFTQGWAAAAAAAAAGAAGSRAGASGNAMAAATALVAQIKASFRSRTAHSDCIAIARAIDAHNVKRAMPQAQLQKWYSYFLSMAAGAPPGSDLQVYFATVAAYLGA